MKFVRFILGATICLLAIYGGYELYVQKFANHQFSEEVIKELREFGFNIGSGDTKEAVSAMMQSDLGTPTASFDMGTGNSLPPPGMPNGATPGGLPSSLRSSTGAASVIQPEPPTFSPTTSSFPPQTPPATLEHQIQNTTPDFSNTTLQSPQNFQSTFDFPVFLNPRSSSETTPSPTFDPPGEATSAGNRAVGTITFDNGAIIENVPQSPIQQLSSPPPPPVPVPEPIQESPPAPWPSAYTFQVVAPPAEEIRTTEIEPTQVQPQVYLGPILPGEQHPANPCQQELATYQPMIATAHPQVQPLPPVWDDPAAIPVNPPVFIPQIVALPPVEDEVFPANAPAPTMTTTAMSAIMPHPPQTTPVAAINHSMVAADHSMVAADLRVAEMTLTPLPTTPSPVQPAVMPQAQEHQQPIMLANGVTPLPQSFDTEIAPAVANKVAMIGGLLTQNQVMDAYEQLSRMYFYDEMTPEERQYVAKHLDQLAGGVLFSRRHHILESPYIVKEGDTTESIATQYKITPELLRKLNGIPVGMNVTVGTELKVLRGPLDAKIYPGYHEMVILMRGNYACRFPISVGSGYAGQEGGFTVQEKDVNRGYQLAPGMEIIPPGAPANPLGSRWIELSREQGTIGVHGTNNPAQIGTTRQSAGYFGLREQDIAEVYDMLIVGSNVTIVR